MLSKLIETSNTNRFIDLEARMQDGGTLRGDFEGSVTGFWVGLGPMGEGFVNYRGKIYVTNPIGFVSIPRDTEVELSYAKGIYYSKF